MATVTSFTADRILELASEWDGIAQRQATTEAVVSDLNTDLTAAKADLATFNNETVPNLLNEVGSNAAAMTNVTSTVVPNLEQELAGQQAAITDIQTVSLPSLQTQTDSNSGWVLDLDERLATVETTPPTTPPPANSPTPEVFAGSGAAVVRWDHVPGATHYTLHSISSVDNLGTPPVDPPSSSTIRTLNAASPMFITDVPLDADTFFAIQAHGDDPAQDPAPSGWVIGRAGPIDEQVMSASLAVVQKVISEIIETRGINIGTSSWTVDEGIVVPNVMTVPVDGSSIAEFTAALTAERLTVKNFLTILGLLNSIAAGAELVMDSGPVAPQTPPTLKSTWPKDGGVGTTNVENLTAFWHVGTGHYVYTTKSVGGFYPGYIRRYIEGQGVVKSISLGYFHCKGIIFTSAANDGLDGDGGSYLLVGQDLIQNNDWYIYKMTSSFTTITKHRLGGSGFFTNRPAIEFWNETVYGLMGWKGDGNLALYTPPISDPGTVGTRWDFSGWNTPFDLKGASVGSIPGGAGDASSILLWRETGNALAFDLDTRAYESSRNVPRANGRAILSAHGFSSMDDQGDVSQYRWSKPAGDLAYAWRDTDPAGTGIHETALSPSVSLTGISKGAYDGFIIPSVPDSGDVDSPDRATIFARTGANPFRLQGIMAEGDTESYLPFGVVTDYEVHGTQPTFASANLKAGRLKSAISDSIGPLIDLDGSGVWNKSRVKNLRRTAPHARCYRSSATLNVPSGISTPVRVNFNGEQSSNQITLSNSNGTFTIQRAGLYTAYAQVRATNPNTAGRRELSIYKNGVPVSAKTKDGTAWNTAGACLEVNKLLDLAVGDTVEFKFGQNSTVAVDITGGSEIDTYMYLVEHGEKV